MPVITIDNQNVTLADDERINVVQAAERAGIAIPYYCWHPGLTVVASCRMCLVEVGQRDREGRVQMQPRLVPACQTPARDGTVVVTDSEKVRENRRFVQEFLLLDHPVDCPICDQAGECSLQDYYYQHGRAARRAEDTPFTSRRRDVGDEVTLFVDRCVMCSRCVRFTREVSGNAELQVIQRGSHAEIDIFPDHGVNNKLAGNVVDLCPVGALCSKDFLYRQRVWFMRSHPSVCTGCSAGCAIHVDENRDTIYRLQPRYNPNANDWWMCDDGRFGWKHVHGSDRLTEPRRRVGSTTESVEWTDALMGVQRDLTKSVVEHGGAALAGVVSPHLTCEEAFLFMAYLRSLAPDALLALGPVPSVGEDDVYPKARWGNGHPGGAATRFTIRAEKCPNRNGVEAVLRHFQGEVVAFDRVREQLESGRIRAAYVTAGYPESVWSEPDVARFSKLDVLVVQDIHESPLARAATIVLPGAAAPEKDGSYVNHAGLLQFTERAIRGGGSSRVDGRVFAELLGRVGLYNAEDVRRELATTVPYFAAAVRAVPEHGLRLTDSAHAT